MSYTGYFPMTHWRRPEDDDHLLPDRGWVFLAIVGICLVVAATGLAFL